MSNDDVNAGSMCRLASGRLVLCKNKCNNS